MKTKPMKIDGVFIELDSGFKYKIENLKPSNDGVKIILIMIPIYILVMSIVGLIINYLF
jgi:hypothetical protein